MSQLVFIGRRDGAKFLAVGTVHQLSKRSFKWEGFERAIELDYPIDTKAWWKKRGSALSGNYQKINSGRVTTMSAARAACLNYCHLPSKHDPVSRSRDVDMFSATGRSIDAGMAAAALLLLGARR